VLVVWLGSDANGSCGCLFIVGAWQGCLVMIARPVPVTIWHESARSPDGSCPAQQACNNFAVSIAKFIDSLQ